MKHQVKGLTATHGGQDLDHLSVVRPWVLPSSGGRGCYWMRVIGTPMEWEPELAW